MSFLLYMIFKYFIAFMFCLLLLLTVFFKPNLSVFSVMDFAYFNLSNICLNQSHKGFSPIFYSVSFIIFHLQFGSLAQFDLKFKHDVLHMKVHFLHMDIQLVLHHLLKNFTVCIELHLHLCWQTMDDLCVGLFLDSLFSSLIYISIFLPIPAVSKLFL